jgi:bacteriocin biosynthesis cyclodehydratase domain-containing protein
MTEAEQSRATLRDVSIVIAHGGSLLPGLVSALVSAGARRLKLVGERPVSALDAQQSHVYLRTDVGRSVRDALEERLSLSAREVQLTADPATPSTAAEWKAQLAGANHALVLIEGPILFYPWLDAFNEAALETGLSWTSAALLDGREPHIGPTIVPGETACYKCYELRYKSNVTHLESQVQFETFIQQTGQSKDFGLLPPIASMVGTLLAIDVVRALSGAEEALTKAALITVDASSLAIQRHPVLKLPRCSACSPKPSPGLSAGAHVTATPDRRA